MIKDNYSDKVFCKYCGAENNINAQFCKNCGHSVDNSTFSLMEEQCQKICKPKCNSLNFDTKIQVSKQVSNKTILEIIPKKSPHIAYIETLKTDFDRLIYNCGGVLGLWFGITPMKVVDLLGYIEHFTITSHFL